MTHKMLVNEVEMISVNALIVNVIGNTHPWTFLSLTHRQELGQPEHSGKEPLRVWHPQHCRREEVGRGGDQSVRRAVHGRQGLLRAAPRRHTVRLLPYTQTRTLRTVPLVAVRIDVRAMFQTSSLSYYVYSLRSLSPISTGSGRSRGGWASAYPPVPSSLPSAWIRTGRGSLIRHRRTTTPR